MKFHLSISPPIPRRYRGRRIFFEAISHGKASLRSEERGRLLHSAVEVFLHSPRAPPDLAGTGSFWRRSKRIHVTSVFGNLSTKGTLNNYWFLSLKRKEYCILYAVLIVPCHDYLGSGFLGRGKKSQEWLLLSNSSKCQTL